MTPMTTAKRATKTMPPTHIKPIAFPLIDAAALDFIAGHGHRHASRALDLFNLHKSVAEGQKLLAVQVVVVNDPLDHHFLGEVLVVVQSSVNPVSKKSSQAQ